MRVCLLPRCFMGKECVVEVELFPRFTYAFSVHLCCKNHFTPGRHFYFATEFVFCQHTRCSFLLNFLLYLGEQEIPQVDCNPEDWVPRSLLQVITCLLL